ncbi:hypothetical protein F3Y22_tig00110338pilonHSYRG00245 [Hibiscus syriacus]|uniref:Uncharacterized protein n=1 Tax=Hibiscus syriacus TaxID=106335 RepID=A0A6A3AY52_HIBSY|nr:hypothetical protein F3Y22_tig00110338pilonHSYRG00245 [Hibiscus syriacus]
MIACWCGCSFCSVEATWTVGVVAAELLEASSRRLRGTGGASTLALATIGWITWHRRRGSSWNGFKGYWELNHRLGRLETAESVG